MIARHQCYQLASFYYSDHFVLVIDSNHYSHYHYAYGFLLTFHPESKSKPHQVQLEQLAAYHSAPPSAASSSLDSNQSPSMLPAIVLAAQGYWNLN